MAKRNATKAPVVNHVLPPIEGSGPHHFQVAATEIRETSLRIVYRNAVDKIAAQQRLDAAHWAERAASKRDPKVEELEAEIASLRTDLESEEAESKRLLECFETLDALLTDSAYAITTALDVVEEAPLAPECADVHYRDLLDDVRTRLAELDLLYARIRHVRDRAADGDPTDDVTRASAPYLCVGPGDVDGVTRCVIEADDPRVLAGFRKQ